MPTSLLVRRKTTQKSERSLLSQAIEKDRRVILFIKTLICGLKAKFWIFMPKDTRTGEKSKIAASFENTGKYVMDM